MAKKTGKKRMGPVEVEATTRVFTTDEVWEDRATSAQEEPANRAAWDAMDPEKAGVVREMICHALRTLIEDTDWIPNRVQIQEGHILDVHLRILLSDMDEELLRREAEYLSLLDQMTDLKLRED